MFRIPQIRFWRWFIRVIGVIVPKRLRSEWKQEWEAELQFREALLEEWERLDNYHRLHLLWRSTSAFWDALWLLPQRWEDELLQDLRFGLRVLFKNPGYCVVAIATLALGIAANTAIFSVVQNVLLRPLPFAHQEQLITLWKKDTTAGTPFVELAAAEVRDWQKQSQSFSSIAAMPATVYGYGYILTGRGDAVQLESSRVSGQFFNLLGVQPALGRVLTDGDDQINGAKVAVISDRFWRERLSADPNIVGQALTLSEQSFTVVGVMPPKFEFPKGVDLWTPLHAGMTPRNADSRGATFLTAIARLKPGVTSVAAEAEMNNVLANIASQHPETEAAGHRIVITPLAHHLFGDARPALWLLLAATGMLLLIATANIANLTMARATARRREFAVRAALGAGRIRLVRQLLIESLILAVAGGVLGIVLARWLIVLLVRIAPADVPRADEVGVNLPVLIFSACLILLTAIAVGLIPALTASRLNVNQTLSEGGARVAGDRAGHRMRKALVIAEVAIAVVLVTGSILILRSFLNLSSVPLGFNPQNVLTMHLRPQGAKYRQPEARREFYRQLIERLEAQPGIQSASAVLIRPMEGTVGWDMPFTVEGQSLSEARQNRVPNFEAVTPHYFQTFRIPLKAGREFTDQDTEQSPPTAIISETMAKGLFGSGDPVGKRLRLGAGPTDAPRWLTIVGVAGDARYRELQDVRYDLYIPLTQWGTSIINHLAIRTTVEPLTMLGTVRRELASLDNTQAVTRVATMEQLVATNLAQSRFSAVLLNWLSGLALLLAALGIYGVLSYSVSRRTGEFGIRIALGAERTDIMSLVMGQGMRLVVPGIAIGVAASMVLTRVLTKLLYGVAPADPIAFAIMAALLLVVAAFACWLPARRATRIDPLTALRHE